MRHASWIVFPLLAACGAEPASTDLIVTPTEVAADDDTKADRPDLALARLDGLTLRAGIGAYEEVRIVRSTAALAALFERPPAVDFGASWVIVYAAGARPTTGYAPEVLRARLSDGGTVLKIALRLDEPGASCAPARTAERPFVAYTIPRPDVTPRLATATRETGTRQCAPLSSVVAVQPARGTLAEAARALADRIAHGDGGPLSPTSADALRVAPELASSVVVSWLEPLGLGREAARFGANNDFLAFFGDGWGARGASPARSGSGDAGWLWANHEYVSGTAPSATAAPTGQHLVLARWLAGNGAIAGDPGANQWSAADLAAYGRAYRQQLGGSWVRLRRDGRSGAWQVDRGAQNLRYDATSDTRTRLAGFSPLSGPDHDDAGMPLPDGVVAGILANCSGAQTPWGTVMSAEENAQDSYGDVEACWSSQQRLVPGAGCDAGGPLSLTVTPSASADLTRLGTATSQHARDLYGFLLEMDPGVAPGEHEGARRPGVGHKKLGVLGRARWENATFVVGGDGRLLADQPIVLYAGDDRRGGRIFKLVTRARYRRGMTRTETRALLDDATVYAAHFAGLDVRTGNTLVGGARPTVEAPGRGRWVRLSLDSTDEAPNAVALGAPGKTVGEALRDPSWNRVGAFDRTALLQAALFTACNKLGISELNRPEDLEWNALDPSGAPLLYVALTNHGRQVALDQDGRVFDPATHAMQSPKRPDPAGQIFAIREADAAAPAGSTAFDYFAVWSGTQGAGDFDAGNPDNLVIDAEGGVWFGTDGNYGLNHVADGIYYLDLDPAHRTTTVPTYGKAIRMVAMPADAEATGPAFTPDGRTLFVSVQHPGEEATSTWPGRR